MRISNDITDEKLDQITVFLTKTEALQLKAYLEDFLNRSADKGLHFHLSAEDHQKEITICIYNPENIEMLHPRAQKLILEDT